MELIIKNLDLILIRKNSFFRNFGRTECIEIGILEI